MDAPEKLPAHWLLLGIAIAVVPVTAAQALVIAGFPYAGEGFDQSARLWLWFLLCGMPIALLIGGPLALWALRDPARGWIAWGLAGAISGLIGAIALCVVLAVTTRLIDLAGHYAVVSAVVIAFGASGGVATAWLARLLAWRLARRKA